MARLARSAPLNVALVRWTRAARMLRTARGRQRALTPPRAGHWLVLSDPGQVDDVGNLLGVRRSQSDEIVDLGFDLGDRGS